MVAYNLNLKLIFFLSWPLNNQAKSVIKSKCFWLFILQAFHMMILFINYVMPFSFKHWSWMQVVKVKPDKYSPTNKLYANQEKCRNSSFVLVSRSHSSVQFRSQSVMYFPYVCRWFSVLCIQVFLFSLVLRFDPTSIWFIFYDSLLK